MERASTHSGRCPFFSTNYAAIRDSRPVYQPRREAASARRQEISAGVAFHPLEQYPSACTHGRGSAPRRRTQNVQNHWLQGRTLSNQIEESLHGEGLHKRA